MNKSIAYPKGFILITSIVLMFVCSSIIFAYFMRISHEYQRVEINIAKAKAKYNALSGFALEAYENMYFRDFIRFASCCLGMDSGLFGSISQITCDYSLMKTR